MTRGKYYINKRCSNIDGSKNVKDYNKNNNSIVYQRTKIKNLDNPKIERVERT